MLIFFLFVVFVLIVGLFCKDYNDAVATEEKKEVAKEMDDIIDKCKKFKDKK